MEIQDVKIPAEHFKITRFQKALLIIGVFTGFGFFGVSGYFLGLKQSTSTIQNKTNERQVADVTATTVTDTFCGIDKFRLSEPIMFGEKQYFIYTRNSMNVVLPKAEKNYLESGVFVADNKKGENCKKIIEIFDESPAKNNIYEFLESNGIFYILAVDQFGAGSGEGNAKILESNDSGATWEVKYCFYYTPEMDISVKDFLSGSRGDIKSINLNSPYCRNFILGAEGGRLK